MKRIGHFSRLERAGIGVLVILVLLVHTAPRWWPSSRQTPFVVLQAPVGSTAQATTPSVGKDEANTEELVQRPFDPNTATVSDLQAAGVSARAARSIVRYRERGGKFRKPEDLKKIYTLSEAEWEAMLPWLRFAPSDIPQKPTADTEAPKPAPTMAAFDPNTADATTLATLGLTKAAVKGILAYRERGGTFRKPQDVQKIYALTPDEYERIAPWIHIPPPPAPDARAEAPEPRPTNPRHARQYATVDLNTATAEQLDGLPGIGASYAARILAYREALGGFVSPEQVREVRGFPDSLYQRIKPYIVASALPLRQININTATVEELQKHPYLNYRQAKAIVEYRTRKGTFAHLEMLQVLEAFDDGKQTFARAKPYLTL